MRHQSFLVAYLGSAESTSCHAGLFSLLFGFLREDSLKNLGFPSGSSVEDSRRRIFWKFFPFVGKLKKSFWVLQMRTRKEGTSGVVVIFFHLVGKKSESSFWFL